MVALLNAFVAVCNTIAYAHSRGVIHRDLKGQNILLGDFGEVLVLDWGLAKLVNHEGERSETESIMGDGDSLREADRTIQGQAVGTPAYMAPEQAAGHQHLIDRRTDIYGLGALLYEILAGRAPFSGSDTHEVLQKVLSKEPIPSRHFWPEVPSALESICARAMAKAPKDRHDQATDLAKEVQGWQEAQRREAEEDLERFFVLALDMLCIAGFNGYFKRLNPAFERILGYTKEELVREPYVTFIHPDDRMITTTEAEGLVTGSDIVSFENRYRCKDGSYRWFLWTATPFSEKKLIYASARDITDRKDAEARLRESEERYRSVIAAMRDGIVLLDSHGAICACNTSAERILGLTQDQMMGRTSLDSRWRAIHEDGSPFPGENFPAATTLRTGEPCSNIVMGVHKPSGELTWICINSQPLLYPDEKTTQGVVVSFSDITQQRIKEEELKGMAAALEVAKTQLHQRVRVIA